MWRPELVPGRVDQWTKPSLLDSRESEGCALSLRLQGLQRAVTKRADGGAVQGEPDRGAEEWPHLERAGQPAQTEAAKDGAEQDRVEPRDDARRQRPGQRAAHHVRAEA